jgi:Protein of unknown function (DUF1428)
VRNLSLQKQEERKDTIGTHTQLFVYRIPKRNHEALIQLQQKLTSVYRKHGTLNSEFFQLASKETFEGFNNISNTIATDMNTEEVWVELDHYKDFNHRNEVVASVGQDPEAGPLFGELPGIVSAGYTIMQGEFKRLKV